MYKIPELLAPAGGMKQLKAAVENGADAVYLGSKLFNARMKAENFSMEELEEAVAYAHLRGVKVYVTLNTLISDKEIDKVVQHAMWLYEIGVDAVILQDLGLMAKLRHVAPNLTLHLSTQGTVYNKSGVQLAKKLGFRRIVLARETTLEEIKTIQKESEMELEVFIHGALCICYSGQCHMSRAIGGRSGNKGVCAQTCRLPFKKENQKEGFYLSPKDLCTIDFLDELSKANITSLKIEGRMKSSEYVAIVTRIYRKYLDIYREKGSYTVDKRDRTQLLQIFNRGNFTTGYLENGDSKDLIYNKLSKHLGVYIGEVIGKVKNKDLVEIKLDKKADNQGLRIGDGIEIHSRELTGNVVTYIKESKNGNLIIGDIKGDVKKGDKIYRITKKDLMEETVKTYDAKSSQALKGYRKTKIKGVFTLKINKVATLDITAELFGKKYEVTVCSDKNVEEAINRPLSEEVIIKNLKKTGEEPFLVENLKIEKDEKAIISIAEINNMRRKAISLLKEKIVEKRTVEKIEVGKEKNIHLLKSLKGEQKINKDNEKSIELYLWRWDKKSIAEYQYYMDSMITFKKENSIEINVKLFVNLKDYIVCFNEIKDDIKLDDVEIVPYLPPITKGKLDCWIEGNIAEIKKRLSGKTLAISNIGFLEDFKNEHIYLYADYGLNIYNEETLNFFMTMGAVDYFPSLELMEMNNSRFKAIGRVPLMISEHLFSSEKLIDRKNKFYDLKQLPLGDKTVIVASNNCKEIDLDIKNQLKNENLSKIRVFI